MTYATLTIEHTQPALLLSPVAHALTRRVAVILALALHGAIAQTSRLGPFSYVMVLFFVLFLGESDYELLSRWFGHARRKRTVIYDADCGVCLWLSRVLKRLDLRHHIVFQGNDDLEGWNRPKGDGSIERAELPKSVTPELVQGTVIAVDRDGHVFTRSRAVAEAVQALPFGQPIAWLMRVPGLSNLLDVLYDAIAARRQRISVLMGKEACGIDFGPPAESETEDENQDDHRAHER